SIRRQPSRGTSGTPASVEAVVGQSGCDRPTTPGELFLDGVCVIVREVFPVARWFARHDAVVPATRRSERFLNRGCYSRLVAARSQLVYNAATGRAASACCPIEVACGVTKQNDSRLGAICSAREVMQDR